MPDRVQTAQLPAGPAAPAAARSAITDWLSGTVDRQAIEDIKLLVSELVTNAVRHPRQTGTIAMDVSIIDGHVRVEVSDPGGGEFRKLAVTAPPPDALGGRGLLIVDRVATRWGVKPGRPTRVWFELER